MSYWDDIPPKRSKDELEPLGACHEGWREKESTHIAADKSAMANKQTNKQNSPFCLVMGSATASTGKWCWLED